VVDVTDCGVLVGRVYLDVIVPLVLGLKVVDVVVFGAVVVESWVPSSVILISAHPMFMQILL
jgi:hypothetical protein